MLPFITNSEFLVRFDYRWVAKNVLDDGTAATLSELQGATGGGAVLATLITEASEMVMGAAAVGDRYTENDVRTYGGQLLVGIVCGLTMGLVLKRRSRPTSDEQSLTQPYAEALEYLESLRRGERIFWQVPLVPEAGLPGAASMQPRPGINPPLISNNERIFGSIACRPWWIL